jgi:hypothetical protein
MPIVGRELGSVLKRSYERERMDEPPLAHARSYKAAEKVSAVILELKHAFARGHRVEVGRGLRSAPGGQRSDRPIFKAASKLGLT